MSSIAGYAFSVNFVANENFFGKDYQGPVHFLENEADIFVENCQGAGHLLKDQANFFIEDYRRPGQLIEDQANPGDQDMLAILDVGSDPLLSASTVNLTRRDSAFSIPGSPKTPDQFSTFFPHISDDDVTCGSESGPGLDVNNGLQRIAETHVVKIERQKTRRAPSARKESNNAPLGVEYQKQREEEGAGGHSQKGRGQKRSAEDKRIASNIAVKKCRANKEVIETKLEEELDDLKDESLLLANELKILFPQFQVTGFVGQELSAADIEAAKNRPGDEEKWEAAKDDKKTRKMHQNMIAARVSRIKADLKKQNFEKEVMFYRQLVSQLKSLKASAAHGIANPL